MTSTRSLSPARFAPRIRDLVDKRLYVFDPKATPPLLQPLVGGRLNARLIAESWPDVLRLIASMATGAVVPSQVLRKLAAYPRQNRLAVALREIGRVERTLFLLDWLADRDLQRRVQIGLNKGETHHALKRAISFHRRGEIRDRTSDGQHHWIAAPNLLAAIIIYWNSWKLGEVVARMVEAGQVPPLDLLPHVSPRFRRSRLLFAHPVPHIRAKETCLAQLCIFGSLPKQARQSTTLDNGSENYLHTKLQEELGIRTYFAHPYCSWQRGTNEYTNGLLRRYFPKRTDFRNVTQEQLNDVVYRLNNTPRKVLQYHTPREVFRERLSQLVEAA